MAPEKDVVGVAVDEWDADVLDDDGPSEASVVDGMAEVDAARGPAVDGGAGD
jgi:hypothetical protein